MNKFLIIGSFYVLFVVSTLSLPVMDTDADVGVLDKDHQALVAISEDGKPEFVVVGDDLELGRAGLSQIRNIFNFSAYLDNRPNGTAITLVPLITILASLRPPQG